VKFVDKKCLTNKQIRAGYNETIQNNLISTFLSIDWCATAVCHGAGAAGAWDELLTFTINSSTPAQFRVGVMASHMDGAQFSPSALRLSEVGGSTVAVSNLTAAVRLTGMVFFDIYIAWGIGEFRNLGSIFHKII